MFLTVGCSSNNNNNTSENTSKYIAASQKTTLADLLFKTLNKSQLPLQINFSEITKECIPFDKSLLINNNIKIYDPGSFTADYIDSKDLFSTAEVYACAFFDVSKKYKAVITKVEDQTTAMSKNIYLILLDENIKPVEGIALSYEIKTPTAKQYIHSVIMPDLTIKIIEKNIDINTESQQPQIINYLWRIDTISGEISSNESS